MRSKTWTENRPQPASRNVEGSVLHPILRAVAEGLQRARQRHNLALLSDHNLRDIGLSRSDVELELRKPFWRP